MMAPADIAYEILALRYGVFDGRRRADNFMAADNPNVVRLDLLPIA